LQNTHTITDKTIPDYDLHMPKSLTYPLQVGVFSLFLSLILYVLFRKNPALALIFAGTSILIGIFYVSIFAFLKRLTNLDERLKARDDFLDKIPWQGNETVLDVGCGNGILTMGAAQRLTSGKAIGIETWAEFAGDSRSEIFLKNAKFEGVADRVVLENEDERHLPYDDETFDVIISSLTIHHLGFDTDKAIQEMTRVLKPKGWMAIYDEPSSIFYSAKLIRQNGLQIEKKTINMVFSTKSL